MGSEDRTESEALFEELCDHHGVPCRRLCVRSDGPQPDYELNLAGHTVVAEVKQIDPNEEDRQFTESLRRDRMATQCRNPDLMARRVRNHIKESRSQINAYLDDHPHTPALLILFDAARNRYTDPYTIQTAMHGWEQVLLNVPSDGQPVSVVGRGFGKRNNREIRPDKNDHLSAVGTLHECWDITTHERFLALNIYHNPHAVTRLMPSAWTGAHITHLKLSQKEQGEWQNWETVHPTMEGRNGE